jgi:hypothetical protein
MELDSVHERGVDERFPASRPAFVHSENQVGCLAKTQEPILPIIVWEREDIDVAPLVVREIEFRIRKVADDDLIMS